MIKNEKLGLTTSANDYMEMSAKLVKMELIYDKLANIHSKQEEKYKKLKEVFYEVLVNMLDYRYIKGSISTIDDYELFKEKWLVKAGLKEQ